MRGAIGVMAALLTLSAATGFGMTAVHGTVQKIDRAAKTIVVKTADGAEQTFKFVGSTAVYGAKEGWKGLEKGTEVVVRYSAKGAEKTAVEIDHLGKDGLKAAEGTVTRIDRAGKTMAVKTADGTETVFAMTADAVEDAGKSGKVVVHYTEEGGKKIARFCKKVI